jgi:C1A family cysteine protease
MNRTSLYYGWRPDLPDHRDFKFMAPQPILADLPASVNLRAVCPPVYDQGQLGSCTANAIAGAFEFELMKQNDPVFTPSRLFIYFNGRVIENTVNYDAGESIRDGMNSVCQQGVCDENSWPYVIGEYTKKPYFVCYQAALQNTVTSYYSVSQDLDQMKGCLASGYPFIFGFTVYNSFETREVSQSGVVNMPDDNDAVVGSHAVVAVGYDDAQSRFIVRNSWGSDWGDNGYFTIPYDYLVNQQLADDFWTIRLVSDDEEANTLAS